MVSKNLSLARNQPDSVVGRENTRIRHRALGEIICLKLQEGIFHAPIKIFPPDAHLYSWGDHGDWLYLIKSGWVKSMTWSLGGKPCLLAINGPSTILGISGFLTRRRAETAMTKTVAEISVITHDQMHQMVYDSVLHDAWNHYLAAYIVEQQETLTHFVTLNSEHRLAMMLLRLGRKVGVKEGTSLRINCRITHDELAQMVGTTRSRVGYFLKRFEARRMVSRGAQALVVHEDHMTHYLLSQR